jgi:hypothetical protein
VVEEGEYCCTSCDAAVFVLDAMGADRLVERRAS